MTAEMVEEKTSFALRNAWVWFAGGFTRYSEASVGLLSHGLNYGAGCFEGIRAYWGDDQLYVFRLLEHFERMEVSARILQMKLPAPAYELSQTTVDLLSRNNFEEDVYIRPVCFKAGEDIFCHLTGVPDQFAIIPIPFGDYIDTGGIRCMVSSWRRIDDNVVPARAKCTGIYVNAAMAKSEALDGGFDEAILLNQDGHVAEGTSANIFIMRDGVWLTPPVTDNILEGITRATLIKLLRDELGMSVVERSIDRTELYASEEVFLCGTGAQVSPVIEIDRRAVGSGKVGPVSAQLQRLYIDVCRGRVSKYNDWLTPV